MSLGKMDFVGQKWTFIALINSRYVKRDVNGECEKAAAAFSLERISSTFFYVNGKRIVQSVLTTWL